MSEYKLERKHAHKFSHHRVSSISLALYTHSLSHYLSFSLTHFLSHSLTHFLSLSHSFSLSQPMVKNTDYRQITQIDKKCLSLSHIYTEIPTKIIILLIEKFLYISLLLFSFHLFLISLSFLYLTSSSTMALVFIILSSYFLSSPSHFCPLFSLRFFFCLLSFLTLFLLSFSILSISVLLFLLTFLFFSFIFSPSYFILSNFFLFYPTLCVWISLSFTLYTCYPLYLSYSVWVWVFLKDNSRIKWNIFQFIDIFCFI